MRIETIHYWGISKEICVDFKHGDQPSIVIRDGMFLFEHNGEYHGPSTYYYDFLMYDICSLISLWEEVYG